MSVVDDPYDLERFVVAQAAVFPTVLAELRAGAKRTHWMWFVFPQIVGLGTSGMAQRYGITNVDEATAYLVHPVLGPRLVECTELVIATAGTPLDRTLGWPDNLKFHSSVTLFGLVEDHDPIFDSALTTFFGGVPDERTISIVGRHS